MTTVRRIVTGSILLGLNWAAVASAQTPPPVQPPVVSPFDKEDPEVATIKSLDWKNADFDALDPKSKCLALMALNKGLSQMGAKADTRVDLLVDYIDQNNLGNAYVTAKSNIPEPPNITFEMMEKVAAAYTKSPMGAAKLSGQLTGTSGDMLNMYLSLYDKSARREFEETREARWQVRSMGLFLQEQGKLDDFKTWSVAEIKRQQDDLAKQAAEQQAQAQQQREERAQAFQQQKQEEQQQAANQQMEMALQSQQQQQSGGSAPQGSTYNDTTLGDTYPWYGYGAYYGYYNSNAYRGYVRDKAQDAYQRWGNNGARPGQLPAQRPAFNRGGMGGGFRGGRR